MSSLLFREPVSAFQEPVSSLVRTCVFILVSSFISLAFAFFYSAGNKLYLLEYKILLCSGHVLTIPENVNCKSRLPEKNTASGEHVLSIFCGKKA